MARFYKTTTPDFVDDFMYTPPWELAGKVMEANEQGIQTALASAQVFEDFDIDYIEDPVVKEKVEGIQAKYADSADEISKNLQATLASNPQSWRSAMPKIGNLAQSLQKDFKSGDIAKIIGDKQRLAAWIEENKELQKTDPMLFNAGYQYFMNEWRSDPERKKDWEGQRLSTFDINSKEIIDAIKDTPIRKQSGVVAPGYIMTSEGRDKNALIRDYMVTAFSDPEAQLYLQQAIQFGIPGFVDEEGEPIPIEVYKNLETGEVVSEEEYEKEREFFLSLNDEEKAKAGIPKEFDYGLVPNEKFAWTKNFINIAEKYGGTLSQDLKADATYNQAANRAATRSNILLKRDLDRQDDLVKENAKRIEKTKEDRRQRNKERMKLRNERDKLLLEKEGETDKDYIKEIDGEIKLIDKQIERLDAFATKTLFETQNQINYSHNMNLLANAEVDSREYINANALDKNVLAIVFNNLGYSRLVGGDMQKDGNSILSEYKFFHNPFAEPFSQRYENAIDITGALEESPSLTDNFNENHSDEVRKRRVFQTYMNFNHNLTGEGTKSPKLLQDIGNYLVEIGYPLDKIFLVDPITGEANLNLTDTFFDIVKELDEITEAKKDIYRTYAAIKKPVNILPLNEDGQEDIRIAVTNNYGDYTVRKVTGGVPETDSDSDKKSKKKSGHSIIDVDFKQLPTIEEIASQGQFQAVAIDSPYGEAVVADYRGEKYFLIPNQGEESTYIHNRDLFGRKEIYEYEEDFNKIIPGLVNKFQSTINSSFEELDKIIYTLGHPNSMIVDDKNRNSKGEKLIYSFVTIPLTNGISVDIRKYHNQDSGAPYSVVTQDWKPLTPTGDVDISGVSETISTYIEYLRDVENKSKSEDKEFTGYK